MRNDQTVGAAMEMETREEPRFVQFNAGDVLEGVLMAIERMTVKDRATGRDRSAIRYTVAEPDGGVCAFLGTYQLNTKLRPTDRGHRVVIRCEGEDVTVKRGDNQMKVFDVQVSKAPVPRSATCDDLGITDADIPF